VLDERLVRRLKQAERELDAAGELRSREQLARYYQTFRERFGPQRLQQLDGEELLSVMHDHGERNSLVYWLEFKNDEEFPSRFGSIAGGSALKFGIYRRRETGAWMTGSPTEQRELSRREAIAIARRHRDELLRAVQLLEALPTGAGDEAYATLEAGLEAEAPVCNSSWGHKYLSLLFSEKLDDFHNPHYQRFYLWKLLQLPPPGDGRYGVAGRFVALARELELPMNRLTYLLKHVNGAPHRYWRLALDAFGRPDLWPVMRSASAVALWWNVPRDLSSISADREGKHGLRRIIEKSGSHGEFLNQRTQQVFNFLHRMDEGDFVVVCEAGPRALGLARVTGGYAYAKGREFPHVRNVEWLSVTEMQLPKAEGRGLALEELGEPENLVAIERWRLDAPLLATASTGTEEPETRSTVSASVASERTLGGHPVPQLSGVPGRIQSVLERKGQVILYGPPGTGKTHLAEQTVRELAAHATFGASFSALTAEQQARLITDDGKEGPLVRMCSFHPAYGYEEFIEGYRPESEGAAMRFVRRDGVFKRLCADARAHPALRFYLIIDEINRGDVPRILGELLTLIEKSKRGKTLVLPVSGEPFSVPENVYLVGTMNTADRSIALLDTALRRRFGFVELMPDYALLGRTQVEGIPVGPWLQALNARICQHVGRDGRNLQIGHAYFMDRESPVSSFSRFSRVVQDELIPLIAEYCYEDWAALERILGRSLVSAEEKRVRHELFEPSRQQDLVTALLAPEPDLGSSAAVQATEASVAAEGEDPGEEEDGAP